MMTKYSVDISEPAENNLKDIIKYIAVQFSASISAEDMLKLLEAEMLSLVDMPERCAIVSDERLSQMGYRMLIVKRYIIFFSIDETGKVVDIERILYGRRNGRAFL